MTKKKEEHHKTTAEHFKLFKEEARYWIKYFGLLNWRIHFEHMEIKEGNWAECTYAIGARTCTLFLNVNWGPFIVEDKDVRMSAFHEVCELMLCNIEACARTRFLHEHEIREAVHDIIRTFENTVWVDCRNITRTIS